MSGNSGLILKSAGLMLLLKLFQRSIGLISTMILARALVPEDFGIIAIVTLVGTFFNVLTQTGGEQYIIQKPSLSPSDLNGALTLDIITKGVIWCAFLICVPFIAAYYEDQRLVSALFVASVILPIGALISPRVYMLKKSINFRSFVILEGVRKVLSFSVVLGVLYFERSYWAVVFGDVASITVAAVGSYVIAPHKPKIDFTTLKEQWGFSQWMLLKGIFGFTRSQLDTLIVSKFFGMGELGKYHMAKHVAYIPTNDLVIPASEPLLSGFAKVANQPDWLRINVSVAIIATSFFVLPMSVFMFAFPSVIVDFFLGPGWTGTYVLLKFLGVAVFFSSLNHILEQAMVATGRVRQVFIFDVVSLFFLAAVMFYFSKDTLNTFNIARTAGLGFIFACLFLLVYRYIFFRLMPIFLAVLPAVISVMVSYVIAKLVFFDLVMASWARFFLLGSQFVAVYGLVVFAFLASPLGRSVPEFGIIRSLMGRYLSKIHPVLGKSISK